MDINEALEIVSYKLGAKNGSSALSDSLLIKPIVEQAISDSAAGTIKQIDLRQYMQATKLVKEERLRLCKVAGEDFLTENLKKDGIQSTESGLQYLILTEGTGRRPTLEDSVTVHYEGYLTDGTLFESSREKGPPATFAVNKVIEGWKEGIQLMPLGSTFKFFIPQQIAYGERGSGSNIPPFSALVFKVELIKLIDHLNTANQ